MLYWRQYSPPRVDARIDQGYSNPSEVDQVVKQARAACRGYGASAEVLVITFYNMQRRELEKEFKRHSDIKHISIASVSKNKLIPISRLDLSGGH